MQSFLTKRANELRAHPTFAETVLYKLLKENTISFKFQSPRWHSHQYRIFDFWLPQPYRIAIEVDGGYHDPKKDTSKDILMKKARPSYKIIRIKNEEVLAHPQQTITYIKSFLRSS